MLFHFIYFGRCRCWKEDEGIYNTYIIDTDYQEWALIMHCAEKERSNRYLSALMLSRTPTVPKNVKSFLRYVRISQYCVFVFDWHLTVELFFFKNHLFHVKCLSFIEFAWFFIIPERNCHRTTLISSSCSPSAKKTVSSPHEATTPSVLLRKLQRIHEWHRWITLVQCVPISITCKVIRQRLNV